MWGESRALYRGLVHTFVKKSRLLWDRVFPTEFGSKTTGGRGRALPGGARVSAVQGREGGVGPDCLSQREGRGAVHVACSAWAAALAESKKGGEVGRRQKGHQVEGEQARGWLAFSFFSFLKYFPKELLSINK